MYFHGITHTPVISFFTLPEYIAIDVPCTNMGLIVASISNSIHVIDKQANSLRMKSVAEIKVWLLYSDTISLWNRTPPGVFPAFLVTTYSTAWIPRMATTKTFHYFPLQIIQRLQLMTYHHVVAFDTQPSKWESVNLFRIDKGSIVVYIYINIFQRL